ncbi:MAG: prepilin-type N-terminal cleavage/methylation domain-containing protein [Patescibacteria group bacterium]
MLHTIKNIKGFTLVELLVATAIIGVVAVIGVQILWDTLSLSSKQNSIESSSENFRIFISSFTNSIQEAKNISILNSNTIQITGDICKTIKLNTAKKWIEEAQDKSVPCTPPPLTSSFNQITQDQILINKFELSPIGPLLNTVFVQIEGVFKDSLGEHPINFSSSVTPRVTL